MVEDEIFQKLVSIEEKAYQRRLNVTKKALYLNGRVFVGGLDKITIERLKQDIDEPLFQRKNKYLYLFDERYKKIFKIYDVVSAIIDLIAIGIVLMLFSRFIVSSPLVVAVGILLTLTTSAMMYCIVDLVKSAICDLFVKKVLKEKRKEYINKRKGILNRFELEDRMIVRYNLETKQYEYSFKD